MPALVSKLPFILAGAGAAVLCLAWGALHVLERELVFNFTVSAPRGMYLVRPFEGGRLARGEYVRFDVPPAFRRYVYGRGWLTTGAPLLKPVGGIEGDTTCFTRGRMSINGVDAGVVATMDRQGLRLPVIGGCVTVGAGQFLPVSKLPNSFDGRYMGPVPMSLVTGRAQLLWTF